MSESMYDLLTVFSLIVLYLWAWKDVYFPIRVDIKKMEIVDVGMFYAPYIPLITSNASGIDQQIEFNTRYGVFDPIELWTDEHDTDNSLHTIHQTTWRKTSGPNWCKR